ncbi:MAG: hypothetical protein OEY67_04745 [Gammaproteobacteria bacterium]|nr:hypothetical protein [Gammaproteobacteria bacterium]
MKAYVITSFIAFATISISCFAYKIPTHETMTRVVVDKSSLGKTLPSLGLVSVNQPLKNSNEVSRSIKRWLSYGAEAEDSFIVVRFLNHFYDPLTGEGYHNGGLKGHPNPSWALEDGDKPYTLQTYSWRDARQYFYDALTLPVNREQQLSDMFNALGHIVHLVEDMGQPQHSRNDSHGTDPVYERYTRSKHERNNRTQFRALLDREYGPVEFNTARSFWHTTDFRGLASYSNLGFVTDGTNFEQRKYPFPEFDSNNKQDVQVEPLFLNAGIYDKVPGSCFNAASPCYMTFYGSQVVDNYNAGLVEVNQRTSTKSIFDQDLKAYNKTYTYVDPETNQTITSERFFSLNRFNYDSAHELLLHRLINYSAGLLDYFFRGRLEITPPDEGVYGIVDHSATNKANTDGFKLIKLKLRNTTMPIQDGGLQPQHMSGGKLVAVAKFHRNPCYEPDLTGEVQPDTLPRQTWDGCRVYPTQMADEEIVVSVPIENFKLSYDPNSTEGFPVSFVFDTPIPINAIDLRLQVVYRGMLGTEQDAVVVNTIDLYEPTFATVFNGTDYFGLDGEFYTIDEIKQMRSNDPVLDQKLKDQNAYAVDFENLKLWVKPGKTLVKLGQLAPGAYARIAYLTDQSKVTMQYGGTGYIHDYYLQGIKAIGWLVGTDKFFDSKKHQTDYSEENNEIKSFSTYSAAGAARKTYYGTLEYLKKSANVYNDTVISEELLKTILASDALGPAADLDPKPATICFYKDSASTVSECDS